MNNAEMKQRLQEYCGMIDADLVRRLQLPKDSSRMSAGADVMLQAMRYSVENGGKRIRPVLALAFCEACGGEAERALPFACAVEMVHTYSLIHDDLPCMDDDDYRRGKLASHRKFGEANALLAGDALLTLAWETALSSADIALPAQLAGARALAQAAGYSGMIAGQVMDLANEGQRVDRTILQQVDLLKTGALIAAACELGCIAADADGAKRQAAQEYAYCIGLAFQIVDDILDVTSDDETLGKPVGSDSQQQKSTYVSLLGVEESRILVARLTQQAKAALRIFGKGAAFLSALAEQLAERNA